MFGLSSGECLAVGQEGDRLKQRAFLAHINMRHVPVDRVWTLGFAGSSRRCTTSRHWKCITLNAKTLLPCGVGRVALKGNLFFKVSAWTGVNKTQ